MNSKLAEDNAALKKRLQAFEVGASELSATAPAVPSTNHDVMLRELHQLRTANEELVTKLQQEIAVERQSIESQYRSTITQLEDALEILTMQKSQLEEELESLRLEVVRLRAETAVNPNHEIAEAIAELESLHNLLQQEKANSKQLQDALAKSEEDRNLFYNSWCRDVKELEGMNELLSAEHQKVVAKLNQLNDCQSDPNAHRDHGFSAAGPEEEPGEPDEELQEVRSDGASFGGGVGGLLPERGSI